MNVTPTSGPIATSNTHHARDATSSRYSFASSHKKEGTAFFAVPSLGERKEHLFQIVRGAAACGGERPELVERAFAADAAAAQQHEAIAHPRRVVDLVNRQEHGPPRRGVGAERRRDVAALAQVEAVERLVGE